MLFQFIIDYFFSKVLVFSSGKLRIYCSIYAFIWYAMYKSGGTPYSHLRILESSKIIQICQAIVNFIFGKLFHIFVLLVI